MMFHAFWSRLPSLFNKAIPAWLFNALFALFLTGVYNRPLWSYLTTIYPLDAKGTPLFLALIFLVLFCLFYMIITILSLIRIEKYVAVPIVLINAGALYFMDQFAIVIDHSMIENILQTSPAEAKEIMGFGSIPYILGFGIFPAWLIIKIKIIRPQTFWAHLRLFATLGIALFMVGIVAFTSGKSFAPLFRNHKEFRYYVLPNNYIHAVFKTAKGHFVSSQAANIPLIESYKGASWGTHAKKTLFVFVVGETGRAGNFSLNGYERETNPLLKQQDILNFTNTWSCGTATAVSVPCMFSSLGRKHFDLSDAKNPNNLFQLVSRAGLKALWVDNNTGCKGLCDGLPTVTVYDLNKKYIPAGEKHEAYDTSMLKAMDDLMAGNPDDTFVVLHQKGSHGPSYYLRTPPEFRKFMPICMTEELANCSSEEIRNSYDNTILFTDYFLDSLINKLKGMSDTYNIAMLYVADHGESLGENNLYLHGLPYMIAPDTQKHVPFIIWLSDGFTQQQGINKACLAAQKDAELSHDYLFHSILDVLDIRTPLNNDAFSIFHNCRTAP